LGQFDEESVLSITVLVLPGFGNSGPLHWQSLWQASRPDFVRVDQRDWDHPVCAEWVRAIEAAVKRAGPEVVLVAHSLACLAVAHWGSTSHSPIRGALMVAVPDADGPNFPQAAIGFSETPATRLSFRSTVVISANDPYGSPTHAGQLANAWGSQIVHIGRCGHINASSGLGDWPAGYALLEQLLGEHGAQHRRAAP